MSSSLTVAEMPDPEDRALQRALPGREHTAEVGADRVADRVGADALGRADRRDRPVVVETLAEQVQTDRPDAVLDRPAQHAMPRQRDLDPVLEVELERRVQALHDADRRGPRVLRIRQRGERAVLAPVEVELRQGGGRSAASRARSLTATNAIPGLADSAFCEPPTATSIPQSSKSKGTAPRLETTSTRPARPPPGRRRRAVRSAGSRRWMSRTGSATPP